MPDIGALAPEPAVVIAPGVRVTVHAPVPEMGNPFKTTVPVDTAQLGAVIVPTVGAKGTDGAVLMSIGIEATDVHPEALVTV